MKTKTEADREAVLLALDQLSQTMDVMRQVVARLKRSVEQADAAQALEIQQSSDSGSRPHGQGDRHHARSETPAPDNDKTPVVVH